MVDFRGFGPGGSESPTLAVRSELGRGDSSVVAEPTGQFVLATN